VNEVLRSPGQPLDATTRALMEPRYGRNFSEVRVHTGSRASDSARAVGALAYTVGRDVVFGDGNYSPGTREGRSLLAHELTHVAQSAGAAPGQSPITIGPERDHFEAEADATARAVAVGESPASSRYTPNGQSGPGRLSRATFTVGPATVNINYGNLIKVTVADFESEIETRFTGWTGRNSATIHTELTALSNFSKEWVLYALDLLVDNPVTGLDKVQAVKRLIEYAPNAKFRALGSAGVDFPNEALSVSGWFEKAVTAGLTAPTGVRLSYVQSRLNPNTSTSGGSSCPSSRPAAEQLDAARLKSDLPPQLEAYLKKVVVPTNVTTQSMTPLLKIADAIQERARTFYSPYANRSRGAGNTFVQQWQYSSHLVSSQSSAGTPTTDLRLAYIDSRARIVGDKGLFAAVHFDPRCDSDQKELDGIVRSLEPKSTYRALVDPILRQKSYTNQSVAPKQVVLNPQVDVQTDECDARWNTVRTMCHELMHVMAHDDFRSAEKGRLIIREGFPEVLGHYLYVNIAGDAGMKKKMEDGLASAPCSIVPGSKIGYDPAGPDAEKIRVAVKNDNFRAAFFLGQLSLVGIQPKRMDGATSNDPLEAEADRAAGTAGSREPAHVTHHAPSAPGGNLLNVGTGHPLEQNTQREMEGLFGHDFTRVRVHTDANAAQSARSVGALAYTIGRDVVFGSGLYTPETPSGRRLLAHELTHVVQQAGASRSGGGDDRFVLRRSPDERADQGAGTQP
jgi:hypothetical protein